MQKRKKKHTVLKILLILLLLIILAAGGVLFAVYQKFSGMVGELNYRELESGDLTINESVKDSKTLDGYTNIALFGLDTRNANLEQANSDVIIVASINNRTKEIKMVSVYRDTYLNIGEDLYRKANAAYANGGPEWAVNMLNTNLDLDITEYVSVDFDAVAELVDAMGGLELTVDAEEAKYINGYCVETSEVTGRTYEPIPEAAGTYSLNGVQVVAYTRIRYTSGNDFKRTERQREVIGLLIQKAKTMSFEGLTEVANRMFPKILTSFSKDEILKLGFSLITCRLGETTGFPFAHRTSNDGNYNEVPVTLESNVSELHRFLFGVDGYQPSETVAERSWQIISLSGYDDPSQASRENFTTGG
jgi:LCP family protein required for cell wall assembly